MRITYRAAAAAGGIVLALVLGACGGREQEPSESASTPTAEASTSSASPSTPESDESPSTDTAAGDTSNAALLERLKAGMGEEGSVHVEMTMTGPVTMDARGDTTYGPDGSEMRLEMTMGEGAGGPMEMVLVDGEAYMSIPGVTEPGKFFEIDESNPVFAQLDDGLSPADSFAAFDAGLRKVDEVGADEIGGQPVTHYRLRVDAAKALDATGQPSVPGLPETLAYDVWLDDQDRMRRLVYKLAGTELTMDMTDWGEDVTIQAPAPGDIVEAPPVMGG